MVQIKIEISTIDRKGCIKQKVSMSAEEFLQLREQMNMITQIPSAIIDEEQGSNNNYYTKLLFGESNPFAGR